MKNRLYCLGGSQNGVRVCLNADHFFSPEDELYSRCMLRVLNQYGETISHPYWRLNRLPLDAAARIANELRAQYARGDYVD